MHTQERERLRARLAELDDADLLGELLALHKVVEVQARGRQRELLEAETTLLVAVLQRLAPATVDEALRRWTGG